MEIKTTTSLSIPASLRGRHKRPRNIPEFENFRMGQPIHSQTKRLVLNVMAMLAKSNPNLTMTKITNMTSSYTGIGVSSIFAMKKQVNEQGKLTTPGKKRCNVHKRRINSYDTLTLNALRRKVHGFYERREVPTLKKLQTDIAADESFHVKFKKRTLPCLLKDIGFEFGKQKHDVAIIERDDITAWRRKYLRKIKRYRLEGRKIYYQDETWINSDDSPASNIKAGRIIIAGIGSAAGIVPDTLLTFKAKKKTEDCNSDINMNSTDFENWMETVFPHLEHGSVIVIDNAPYHTVKHDPFPTASWRKPEIQQWCEDNNAFYEPDALKSELLEIVASVANPQVTYRFDNRAEELGFHVIRLPPYHWFLNPIEMVWSEVKRNAGSINTTSKMADVQKLIRNAMAKVTPEHWANYEARVVKEEDILWQTDCVMDDIVDRLAINSGNDDNSTSTDFEYSASDGDDDTDASDAFGLCSTVV